MNTVALVGRLTRDPELRQTQSGIAVVRFTVAVDRPWKDANGERKADFISCQAWRSTAEFIERWFSKGQRIGLTGRIETGQYEKDGRTVYTTDVIVDQAEFVESKASAYESAEREAIQGDAAVNHDTELPFDL